MRFSTSFYRNALPPGLRFALEPGLGWSRREAVSGAVIHPQYAGLASRDHAADGRKGGSAPRRSRFERQLVEKVVEAKNGWAAVTLLKLELERQGEIERRRIEADRQLVELESWAGRARLDLEEAIEQREREEARLEEIRSRLDAASHGDHDALVELLRSAGEEAVERACDELGWIEDVPAS
jgi:hypothetical protein